MNVTRNNYTTIDTDVLVKAFLKALNNEGYINNKTYLASLELLEKGDENNVSAE